jgi:DNA-binding transcriptional LysR family regulator
MGVTQSAMSHTLRSLRSLMNDPLLVRVGNDMVLTPYAEQTQARLQRGLTDLESVVSGRAAFDPSTITDTFTVALQDGPAAGVAAELFRELRGRAPHAKLRIQPLDSENVLGQLGDGGVDAAFVAPIINLDGLSLEPLPPMGYAVVCRRDHPVIGKKVSLAQYCKVPHAMISISGEGPSFVDHMLDKQGKSREVQVRVPYLMALAEVVASSDLVAAVPTVAADFLCELWPLKSVAFPLPFKPMAGFLAWHPRFDADPPRVFFREVVKLAFEASAAKGKAAMANAAMVKNARRRN